MQKDVGHSVTTAEASAPAVPSGGVAIDGARLRLLAPQWEATSRTLRRMDNLPLGETEPALLFVWKAAQP